MKHTQSSRLLLILVVLLISAVYLVSCTNKDSARLESTSPARITSDEPGGPSVSMVEGLEAREALALANKWGRNEKRVTSFVDSKNVSFEFENGDKISVPLPENGSSHRALPGRNASMRKALYVRMSGRDGECTGKGIWQN